MATSIPATQLAQRIETLLETRQQHVDAIAAIDETLTGVGAALGGATSELSVISGPVAAVARKTRGPAAAAAPQKGSGRGGRGRGRGRSKFATSAEESILAFLDEQKNPTTSEIKAHYVGEGRGGSADNTLSKLYREGKVKRTPLGKGIRGSRYSRA